MSIRVPTQFGVRPGRITADRAASAGHSPSRDFNQDELFAAGRHFPAILRDHRSNRPTGPPGETLAPRSAWLQESKGSRRARRSVANPRAGKQSTAGRAGWAGKPGSGPRTATNLASRRSHSASGKGIQTACADGYERYIFAHNAACSLRIAAGTWRRGRGPPQQIELGTRYGEGEHAANLGRHNGAKRTERGPEGPRGTEMRQVRQPGNYAARAIDL